MPPLSARVRAQSLQPKKSKQALSIVMASSTEKGKNNHRGGSAILRHVRSTIVPSPTSPLRGASRSRLTVADTRPSALQSCSSPPSLSRELGKGTQAECGKYATSSRVRTISASATPLSAIRTRTSIFAPKRWSNFLRTSHHQHANEDGDITLERSNNCPFPSISLPFNVRAAEGSALMTAVTNQNAMKETSTMNVGGGVKCAKDARPHRFGLNDGEIQIWLQDTAVTTITSSQARSGEGKAEECDKTAELTEQSIYVIAPEHSIHSDDLSFSTCPTPVLESLTHTPSTRSTPNMTGTPWSFSSPVTDVEHRSRAPPSLTTSDVSAWGSHPEGLCISNDELSNRIQGILRDRVERDKQDKLCPFAMPHLARSQGRDLRDRVSVTDFLQVAREPRLTGDDVTSAHHYNRLSVASSIYPASSMYSESVCGHESDVMIRTAWRANVSHVTTSHGHDKDRRREQQKRPTLFPLATISVDTHSRHNADALEECKTPRQQRNLAHTRNSSCPPSPTTMTTTATAYCDAANVRTTSQRSMTVPTSTSLSTLRLDDERDSFDLCEHLLQRARQHRRYAIHE